ncbi:MULTISPECIES: TylF/MycF/NovP-related O-methyltransferase [unclassified Thalassospira]|nr:MULTISPECIES: TylF/MycF/NovP-related O-methyltransferase [unclassified Thalassospira]BDW90337.1 hypothetical protein MACH01_31040 [Thalassospira tepidiphila]
MYRFIRNKIENQIEGIVRRSILDWPLSFGVETAVMNNVVGDYHEFGVFRGRSFSKVANLFQKHTRHELFSEMKFWAYDSFAGLPETADSYAPSHFEKGAFSASRELFHKNVTNDGVASDQIGVVEGFYDESLTEDLAKEVFSHRKVAMTYIDCDIYESAVPIFNYLQHGLQVGSVIVIDDWVRHHCHPMHGIQRAWNEWLQKTPNVKVTKVALSKRIMFVVHQV